MKELLKKYWIGALLVLVIMFGFGRMTAPQKQFETGQIGKVSEARAKELLISYVDALNNAEKQNLQLNQGVQSLVQRLQALKDEKVNNVLSQFGVK